MAIKIRNTSNVYVQNALKDAKDVFALAILVNINLTLRKYLPDFVKNNSLIYIIDFVYLIISQLTN